MYQLKIGKELLYKQGVESLAMVSGPTVSLELNKSGTLDFEMDPNHPFYNQLSKLTTYIDLYDNNVWINRFRIISEEIDFYKIKKIECEGILSFFIDTIQNPYVFKGTIVSFLEQLINCHNQQVEKEKQVSLGMVTIMDRDIIIRRKQEDRLQTLESINSELIDYYGGYLRIRRENSKFYLDYLKDYGVVNEQKINFGENLLDIRRYIKADTIKTAIIPFGSEIKGENKRVTIESVNNGNNYLLNKLAIKKYGYIWNTVIFDDISTPDELLERSKEYLEHSEKLDLSIEIKAIDLTNVGIDTTKILVGHRVYVKSSPHSLEHYFLVSKLELHLESPEKDIFSMGTVIETYAANQVSKHKEIPTLVNKSIQNNNPYFNNLINNATNIITGGTGGYLYTTKNKSGKPEELLFMDNSDRFMARNILRINKNGIGFTKNGIQGPYEQAWTIDGNFNADFINGGTLNGILIKGNDIENGNGTFKVNKDGNMVARSATITGNINGSTITGGKISGAVIEGTDIKGGNISVDSDVYIGKALIMEDGTGTTKQRYIRFNNNSFIAVENNQVTRKLELRFHMGYQNYNSISNLALGEDGYATLSGKHASCIYSDQLIQFYSNGEISANKPIETSSDKRLKKNIQQQDFSNIFDEIDIKRFDYIDGSKNYIGVIAQDLLKLPFSEYFVGTIQNRDGTNYYTVNYQNISMALVQKVQKQQIQINQLIKRIEEIERKI